MALKGQGSKPGPFLLYQNEHLVECPYNMSHQVTNLRMMTHLLKCRRNYAKDLHKKGESVLIMVCKYNWTHHVPAPELMYHEENCSDRYSVYSHLLTYNELDDSNPDEPVVNKAQVLYVSHGVDNVALEAMKKKKEEAEYDGFRPTASGSSGPVPFNYDDSEDWEEDCRQRGYRSYDPRVKINNDISLKFPPNLTKSERKSFVAANTIKAKRLFQGLGIQANPVPPTGFEVDDNFSARASAISLADDDPRLATTPASYPFQRFEERRSSLASVLEEAPDPEKVAEAENRYKNYLEKALRSGLDDLRRRDLIEEDLLSSMPPLDEPAPAIPLLDMPVPDISVPVMTVPDMPISIMSVPDVPFSDKLTESRSASASTADPKPETPVAGKEKSGEEKPPQPVESSGFTKEIIYGFRYDQPEDGESSEEDLDDDLNDWKPWLPTSTITFKK